MSVPPEAEAIFERRVAHIEKMAAHLGIFFTNGLRRMLLSDMRTAYHEGRIDALRDAAGIAARSLNAPLSEAKP